MRFLLVTSKRELENLVHEILQLHYCLFVHNNPPVKQIQMIKVCVNSLLDNLGMINLIGKSASQLTGKAASNISAMLQDVFAVHRINVKWGLGLTSLLQGFPDCYVPDKRYFSFYLFSNL